MSALRTRFAPSPTGSLHVGGVRTALYAMLVARRERGTFVVRIEDTDRARSTDEAALGIVRDLRWVGLHWDEGPERDHPHYGPYFQSQRLELYTRHARQLVEAGLAYEAWETPAELDAERKAAEARKENYRFRRREYTAEQLATFRDEGRTPVIRFHAPRRAVTVQDLVRGEVTVDDDTVDDFVIIKADGFPTYHFAVVIDDHFMDIGLVLRGEEHLMNTHKHLLLYEAFGWAPPAHGHLPVINSPGSNSKMGKRDKAKAAREAARARAKAEGATGWGWLAQAAGLDPAECDAFMQKKHDKVPVAEAVAAVLGVELPMVEVMDFRVAGYLPEALLNYLALLGWSPGDDREILSMGELTALFDLERVNKTAARFDPDKLAWMNAEYMKALPDDVLLDHLAQWAELVDSPIRGLSEEQRERLLAMYRPRARTFRDILRLGGFLFRAPTAYADKQLRKHLDEAGWQSLAAARAALGELVVWDEGSVREAFDRVCAAADLPIGRVAQPVRIALSGDGVSPEIPATLAFLGQAESLARIDALLALRPH
jgi:glutamyl/glutaminyl-tRNA synthetase